MTATPLKPASQRAAAWATELQHLNSFLQLDPANPEAWRWRMQVRILSFLIARYGTEPSRGAEPVEHVASSPVPAVPFPERHSRSLRARGVLRQFLERIADANQQRRK